MNDDRWLQIILALLGLGFTITVTLLGILFTWLKARIDRNEETIKTEMSEFRQTMNDRLRSLGHEDRDIRTKIEGIWKLFLEDVRNRKNGGK